MYKLGGKSMQCPECENTAFDLEDVERKQKENIITHNVTCTCLQCGTEFLYEERYTILKAE